MPCDTDNAAATPATAHTHPCKSCHALTAPGLVAVLAAVLGASPSWAQAGSAAPGDRLEHVVITVPIHRQEAETALPVTVLAGEALRERAAASIGETLAGMPGLSSASFGPAVGQPVIRGHSGPRVRVLQNGIGSADASANSADHAVTVEPLLADSIEVLRGPATLLYGGGAIGGVVNVIDGRVPTTMPEKARGALELRHGSAADTDVGIFRLDGGAGHVAWHLSGVYRDWSDVDIPGVAFDRDAVDDLDESSRGYLANSGGRNHAVTGGVSLIVPEGYVGIAVASQQNRYGIPPGGHEHTGHEEAHDHSADDDHEELQAHAEGDAADDAHEAAVVIDMEQTRFDLKGARHLHGWIETARAHLAYTDYQHREVEDDGVVGTTFTNETWEGRLELVHTPARAWHGVLGLQWRSTDFAALGEEAFVPPSETDALGFFWLEDYHAGAWTYELGLRLDHEQVSARAQQAERFLNWSGSAAVLWRFDPAWRLGMSFALAGRGPTAEELFANVGRVERHGDHFHFDDPVVHAATRAVEVGDTGLDSEQSRNIDISLSHDAAIKGEVTAFYNDFRDYIYLRRSGLEFGEMPVLEYGQQDARLYGLEVEASREVAAWQRGALTATAYGDLVRGELDDGSDIPRLPPWRVGLRLALDHGAIAGYLDWRHAAEQRRPGAFEPDSDSYARLDAGVSWRTPLAAAEATWFLRGRNLTDATIRDATSLLRSYAPEPGRSVEAGVRLSFD